MRYIFFILIAYSFICLGDEDNCNNQTCQSQLVRVDLSTDLISNLFQTSTELRSSSLDAINTYVNSDSFRESFETNYPIPNIPFPHNYQLGNSKKASGNVLYQDIECMQENLCANESVAQQVRSELCLSFPCPFFKGDINECPTQTSYGSPAEIRFPSDAILRDIEIEPL